MELIILSITPYKEKDGIITAISSEGVISFNVRSLLDPKSASHILNNPLIIVDAIFQEGNYKHKVLKNAKILFSPYKANDSLDKLAIISLLQEASKNLLQEDEQPFIFDKLKKCLFALKDSDINMYFVAINYLFNLLKITGNELELNGCVFCGSRKEIKGLSFSDGGFVCKNCIEEQFNSDIPLELITVFRLAALSADFSKNIEGLNNENGLFLLKKLGNFIHSALGVNLKSLKLL